MTQNIDLNKYKDFVEAVTSKPSNDLTTFMDTLDRLDSNCEVDLNDGLMKHGPDVNIPLLLTACLGLAAESGEFIEIPKKIFFQGKALTDENVYHMKRELGDVIWYWINACRALNLDPNEVIAENVKKLENRYPGGSFDAHYSENRKGDDI
jgi:NTP pyrophosphatase (non-canonical NTP hydrolase)